MLTSQKILPYFRWYPADRETEEFYSSLTDRELGFFHRCLNRAWCNGATLPADSSERARTLKVSRSYGDKMWEIVGRGFITLPANPSRVIYLPQFEEWSYATS